MIRTIFRRGAHVSAVFVKFQRWCKIDTYLVCEARLVLRVTLGVCGVEKRKKQKQKQKVRWNLISNTQLTEAQSHQ